MNDQQAKIRYITNKKVLLTLFVIRVRGCRTVIQLVHGGPRHVVDGRLLAVRSGVPRGPAVPARQLGRAIQRDWQEAGRVGRRPQVARLPVGREGGGGVAGPVGRGEVGAGHQGRRGRGHLARRGVRARARARVAARGLML